MIKCETTIDLEIAVADYFGIRQNLIVPNISWGMGIHECDLLIVTGSGFAYEIEIKISKSDLIKDKLKYHKHFSEKIKKLYFAIPKKLEPFIEHIPDLSGIIIVDNNGNCKITREAKTKGNYKFSEKERLRVARLGTMRIWGLKRKIAKAKF